MRRKSILNLVELIIFSGIQFLNGKKVLNNYGIWESGMNEILIDGQAANITTKVLKNSDSLTVDQGVDERTMTPVNKQNYVEPKYSIYNNIATIEPKDSNSDTKILSGVCECSIYGVTCWTKSKCIGIASTISIITLFLFICLTWFMQIISGHAAKEEHVILKKEIIKEKQSNN
ncbi:hypothetical protein FG379_001939 [Cryptosporidium bovis]|uniref:uncharacterized protein n=1 Tax=Cryptosporidium bovis TaxID=310047 RepID=UPI00351A4468|nr:hypothetical protein FG379_001939 [Cryptosporidium bovis]